jgi:hypothetical protein
MKKHLAILSIALLFLTIKVFSQTVYVNQSGTTFHTKACKVYTSNFEAVPLWKARDVLGKKPCQKCNPPIKDAVAKKQTPVKKKIVKKKAVVKK